MIPPPLILFSLSVELYGPYVYKLHRIRQEVCLAIYKSVNTISGEEVQGSLKLSRFTRNTRRVCQLIIEGHFSFFYPLGFLSSLLLLFGEQCHISCSPLNRSIVYLKVQDKSLPPRKYLKCYNNYPHISAAMVWCKFWQILNKEKLN